MEISQIINDTLEAAGEKIQTELGGLLDCELSISSPRLSLVTKAKYFADSRKKLVLTRFSVNGEKEGDLFVFCHLRDAVKLGGILIMLPPAELEKRIKNEDFGEEEADAFGEIANIISGDLSTAFDELYPEKLHFKKAGLEIIVPSKVKPADPEPFPPGTFLFASYAMSLDGQVLNDLELLFPADILGIQVQEEMAPPEEAAFVPTTVLSSTAAADSSGTTRAAQPAQPTRPGAEQAAEVARTPDVPTEGRPIVLVLASEKASGDQLVDVLRDNGWQATLLGGKENFKEVLQSQGGEVRGVFLVMGDMEEQNFAATIKIRSACGASVPLVAAGSHWTKTKVLQAVKYGICDILVLPASPEEILEKVTIHFAAQ